MSDQQELFRDRTIEDVQADFFLHRLPRPPRSGRYLYRSSGLAAKPGTVVLFQYANRIIASAVFERREKFEHPDGEHDGALYFDVSSIKVFDPVGSELLAEVWPGEIARLGQAKYSLDPSRYPAFVKRLKGVRTPAV